MIKNIIFMGSPEFAIPSLQALINSSNYNVVSVYTKPPKPSGRGGKISKTPVHILAERYNIEVLTPKSLKNHFIQAVDAIVLVAYSLLIPKHILEIPKYGCINLHPSLLPRWRGASPIESAIIAGDEVTGISIMRMNEGLDEGDVFSMEKVPIENDDFTTLHNKLAVVGSRKLIETLDNIEKMTTFKQSNKGVTYAPKITKSLIDWNNPACYIEREIKALSGKSFYFRGKLLKILRAECVTMEHDYANGDVINNELHIACAGSILIPKLVQPEGKKTMPIKDFLNGLSL